MEMFFLFFGLGFFIYCMNFVRNDDHDRYMRRTAEIREFGFREDLKSPEYKAHKK